MRPGEGWQFARVGDVVGGGSVAMEETEDKLGVLDGVADVSKSGDLDLEALAVLVDRRVAGSGATGPYHFLNSSTILQHVVRQFFSAALNLAS